MKKFAKELITNRFGIVLATLNICYFFFSKNFFSGFFNNCEENYSLCDRDSFYWINVYCVKLMVSINSVITDAAIFISKFLSEVADFSDQTYLQIQIFSFISLMIFQWLFIAWLSYKIAQKIRGN